ncbi:MAG TPA: PA domain-containing protein [Candidatus Sulfotelmatobacter sp.]|nr:PA domain-containing protein [Candidatus Sulfotelmatobacter sp.]
MVQLLTNYWTTSTHTTLVSFNDLNGTNYNYAWQFTVMGGALAPTNSVGATNNIFTLPLASRVDRSTLRQPGFRVRSHQMYFKQANSIGTAEEEFEGLHGPNLAFQFATNGPGFFVWNDVLDFRKASGTGTGGAGTFNSDFDFNTFGMTPVQQTSGQNNVDNCALDVGVWLDFPMAGIYIIHINTDDGFYLTLPAANEPFNKLGTVLAINDGGRGVNAEVTSGVAGGTYAVINVPAPGGYPFRLLYENGTSDAAVEWSIYQPLADGTVAKVPVNDPANPQSIKAYQVSTMGSGPFVTYANPAPYAKDIVFYQPVVVDLTDGPSLTTGPSQIDSLTVNGVSQTFTASKAPGTNVTHIVQNLATPWTPNMNHTNVLIYRDSAGNSYSNYWVFTTLNISPYGIVQLPASNAVPLSALDLTQPGFRVKPYQVPTNSLGTTIAAWEAMLEGLAGANIADLSLTNGPGFFTTTSVMDFNNATTGGANAGNGEWEWDLPLNVFGIQANTVGSSGTLANLMNYCVLDIGTYLYFPKAGNFIMELNTDDDFRLTVPYGNPFNKYGVYLSAVENGHGATGAGFGPRSGTTYVTFNVPTPGAYPFRLLFANITGGAALEWSIFEYLADGSVAQVLLGDTNTPGTIQAYQVSTQDTPSVAYLSPVPGNVYGPNQPVLTLAGNSLAGTLTNNGPVQSTDIVFALANSQNSVINTNTLTLSLNGYVQPVIVTNDANGWTWVVRPANASTWWPSGQAGTLMVNFQDTTGRTINMPLMTIATPFWGTLSNGLPLGRGDTNKPGFLVRSYAVNQSGGTSLPTRVHTAEQVLAGIWGANVVGTSAYGNTLSNGYYVLQGAGRTAGVVNFNPGAGNIGDFQSPTNVDQLLPGIPALDTTAGYRTNSFASEFLTYVEFPTAGTYTLGVNSDDGFRLTQGFNPPANNGAMLVNSPAVLAGAKPTVQDTYLASYSLTNFVTGNLVLVQGPYAGGNPPNLYGSTNYNGLGYSVDGCMINNGAQLAGNIALIYRSTSCGFAQQVQNAAAAGAIAVVFVQNRPSSEGWFPIEAGVTPMQPIPAVMINQTDGLNLIAAMATNTVNVTLTPMDYLVNPPAALSPLGQADVGKGSSDVLFPVVVPQPGVYPLRLVWFQGGGGANVEFFSVSNGQRVLVNDLGNPAAPALKAYYGTAQPTVKITSDGTTLTVTFTGTLQTSSDLKSWSDVSGSSPLSFPISSSSAMQFFRARY